ncbi:MAG: hypothetical protein JXR23_06300 [Pontiellaceae bacterium]|nr:hypothetical protein [Pontiellaceae bacterium]
MSSPAPKKKVKLLGVGFDAEDGHIRITQAEKYNVLMGSQESHQFMVQLIEKIDREVEHRGWVFDELSPDQLTEITESVLLDNDKE